MNSYVNNEGETNNSIYNLLVMFSLIVTPILQMYSFFGINLSSFVVGILVVWGFITGKYRLRKKALPYYLWIYFLYFIGVTILSGVYNISEMPNRVAGVFFLLFQFTMFFTCSDKNTFYRIYKYVAIITIVFFFIQEAGYKAVGFRIPGVIPFLPLDPTYAALDSFGSFADYLAIVNRSTSFFSEPAHFAQFLIPFLAMSIFLEKGIYRWIFTIASIITLFLLQSGNGIIGLGCVIIFYLFYLIKSRSAIVKIVLYILIPIAILYGGKLLNDSSASQYYGKRASELTMNSSNGEIHSGFYRIYRGYYVYDEYNIFEKIIGINNFSQIGNKIRQSSVAELFSEGDLYFNVIQAFLIKTGLIGLFLYVLLLVELWGCTDNCGKSLLITFIVFSFMSALHMSSIMIVYFLISYYPLQDRLSLKYDFNHV